MMGKDSARQNKLHKIIILDNIPPATRSIRRQAVCRLRHNSPRQPVPASCRGQRWLCQRRDFRFSRVFAPTQ